MRRRSPANLDVALGQRDHLGQDVADVQILHAVPLLGGLMKHVQHVLALIGGGFTFVNHVGDEVVRGLWVAGTALGRHQLAEVNLSGEMEEAGGYEIDEVG